MRRIYAEPCKCGDNCNLYVTVWEDEDRIWIKVEEWDTKRGELREITRVELDPWQALNFASELIGAGARAAKMEGVRAGEGKERRRVAELAKKAWELADKYMRKMERMEATGLEWTGAAKMLEELGGEPNKWGMFEQLGITGGEKDEED